jgi:phosphoglycerate kinase
MMDTMKTITDVNVKNKKVLVRLDLDVPVVRGEVGDLTRIESGIATLRYLVEKGATPIILSHAGRPDGKVDEDLSLRPMLAKLMELLGGHYTYEIIDRPMPGLEGTIFALENVRFNAGEEANDPEFAKYLATFGDMYVNESFAVSHRDHASITGVAGLLPAYAGIHLAEEISRLDTAMHDPQHPVVVILGGAKVETKMPAIQNMSTIADTILLGGKLVLEAEPEAMPEQVSLPVDMNQNMDIGPESMRQFAELIAAAKTIIWNGPMGKFEEPPFDAGTRAVADAIAANTGANRIVGGGDTLAALDAFGLLDRVGYVSTGGGAMLDFLAGKEMPGLKALGYYAKG